MADWTDIPDSVLEIDKPIRSIDIVALRDNIPAMAEAAAGAPLLGAYYISSGTASAVAQLDFLLDSTKWKHYTLLLHNIQPATNTTGPWLRVGSGVGPTYRTSAYEWASTRIATSATGVDEGGTNDSKIPLLGGQTIGTGANLKTAAAIQILSPHDSGDRTRILWTMVGGASGGVVNYVTGGAEVGANEDNNSLRFMISSGNIATVKYALLGHPGQS